VKLAALRKEGRIPTFLNDNDSLLQSWASLGQVYVDISPKVRFRFARRPFLHVIVLFATDARVMKYSTEVAKCFLNNGFDVLLQTKTADDRKKSFSYFLFIYFFFFVYLIVYLFLN
jgi:hypothetical protein